MSLVARHLEEAGIPTLVAGSAKDIVEECGVARFLFSDFPLGNPMGRPDDTEMQRMISQHALDLFESARLPRTTVQVPVLWSEDPSWKASFAQVKPEEADSLRRQGKMRRAKQKTAGN